MRIDPMMMKARIAAIVLAVAMALGAEGLASAQSVSDLNQYPTLGSTFPAFDTTGLDGAAKHVAFPNGTTTVLLFFSSGCPVCHRMIPEWNRAYERRPKGLNIVGVLMDKEPPGFFATMPVSFPVVRTPGLEFTRANRVNRVPLTLRVAPGGKIEDLSMGIVDPIRLGELFRP